MKTQRLTIALTVVNLSILLIVLLLFTTASKPEVASVVRGHAFELVDEQGKVRAEPKGAHVAKWSKPAASNGLYTLLAAFIYLLI